MADFRKWFYALAVVALLAGLTVPASAQGSPPFQCSTATGVPPDVRWEGYTELIGDIILNCNGGQPTPAGQVVQPVDITISITTNLTSRLLSGGVWTEALAIVDDPHSAVHPARNILNCGNTGAADSGPSGHNVCAIISDGNPADTYDGTPNAYGTTTCTGGTSGTPAANSYSCGRPNVFQGRLGSPQNPNQYNAVSWLGLPLDPPGTTTNRTIRFTNIRANANGVPLSTSFFLSQIQAQVVVNGNTSLSLSIPGGLQTVAYVVHGLQTAITQTNFRFLQCVGEYVNAFTGAASTILSGSGGLPVQVVGVPNSLPGPGQANGKTPSFTFTEGFASSWKAKNIAMILNTSTDLGNGVLATGDAYWHYNYANPGGTINYPTDLNQNVPGAIYNTESGFEYPPTLSDPSPNPPFGTGTVPVTSTANALSNSTGISAAGVADQGTRLQLQISNIPAGANVLVPEAILLNNGTGTPSGVAVLTNTASDGSGKFSPVLQTPSGGANSTATGAASTYVLLPSSGMAVYEILFADPFSIESATVFTIVSYVPNLNALPNGQPDPTKTAQAFGGFAPFENPPAAYSPFSGLPVPRFIPGVPPSNPNYFSVEKCSCNLLFPYVVTASNYDTGIAIANTSQDNLGPGGSSAALSQFGTVTFWFYGTQNGGGAPPSQTSASVPAGQVLAYELAEGGGFITNSTGGTSHGLTAVNGFTGYVIAQAQFQYCHAYAFIGGLGAGPLQGQVSQGYLGLSLDNSSWNCLSNAVGFGTPGLCRTFVAAENLVH